MIMGWRVREFVPKCYAGSCHVAFGLKCGDLDIAGNGNTDV